jgi:hypothetical protein
MFNSEMFFTMTIAFVVASIIMELFSFCLGLYLAKKQMKRQKAFEEEYTKALAEGKLPPGMDPMQAMMAGLPMPMSPDPTTVSGEVDPNMSTGQYL